MKDTQEKELIVSHQSDLLTQDLVLSGVFEYSKLRDYGLSFDAPFIRYEHPSGNIFYPKNQALEFEHVKLSQEKREKLIRFLEDELNEYKNYLSHFKEEIQSSENALHKITTFFEKSKQSARTIPYFYLERSLQKDLQQENISPDQIPSALTDTTRASLELEKLYTKYESEIKEYKETQKKIPQELHNDLQNFCDRFAYLGMIYFKGRPWTQTDVFAMLLHLNPHNSKQYKTLKEENLTPSAQTLAQLLKLRTQKWELMCYGAFLFRKFMIDSFSNLIHYEDILSLRIQELIDLFKGSYPPADIKQKRDAFVLEITQNGVVLTEKEKDIPEEKRDSTYADIQSIKGMTAQGGKVQARVKIILSPDDGFKMKDGDILVTKMSTPNFLPLMKKASAFITDIGGITSHAAIISREMKKPCIIGTQNATKVLNDGDLVEVDADNGVVRILERV